MKTQRLDRRYTGFQYFKFGITFVKDEREKFVEIRKWCWETFGASSELENFWVNMDSVWAWESGQWSTRIYFKSDKELAYFKLKWT